MSNDDDEYAVWGTSIYRAVYDADIERLRDLLSSWTEDMKEVEQYGRKALDIAAVSGHVTIIEALHEAGKLHNINAESYPNKWTALHYASYSGCVEVVKKLLEYGADVTAVTIRGETPLMLAAHSGHADVIDAFHEAGKLQNINATQEYGYTALLCAVAGGQVEAAEKLLEYGSNTKAKDVEGNTPLMLAAELEDYDMICMIIDNINNMKDMYNGNR